MEADDNPPVVLTKVPTEVEAALIIAALDDAGIRAEMSGALASAFRAEAPGEVEVLILKSDSERARAVLDAAKHKD